HPWLQRTQLFEAIRDSEGRVNYRDATDDAGPGLAPLRSARGIALADADDDGDVDALVVDLDERPRLLENRSVRKGAWVSVHLVGAARPGAPKGSNRDGYGARVSVTAGDRTWVREMRVSQGVYSSSDPRLHFGLGAVSRIDRIEIRWPSGREQTIDSPPLGRVLTIHEPEAAR
ncbi:MAG TPA: ASPIC/UnbV domain-containing protein, partial [Planctomycetota bacterium]|nr:ASPIC/UnbV domain-containing protein [Planctomycetota bacterium]